MTCPCSIPRQEHKYDKDLSNYDYVCMYKHITPKDTISIYYFTSISAHFKVEINRQPNSFSPCTFGKTHLSLPASLKTLTIYNIQLPPAQITMKNSLTPMMSLLNITKLVFSESSGFWFWCGGGCCLLNQINLDHITILI